MVASRQKTYIETNVYDEAKKRMHYLFDTHDDVVVSFSGGKDSMVAMHIAWEVAQERGLSSVKVMYRDEELVPAPVWGIASEYFHKPWCDMTYFTCQWEATAFILGRVRTYLQWDDNRVLIRPKPPWATTLPGTYDELFGFDKITATQFSNGKVALVTGVRAEESMNRWRSVVNRTKDNYISPSKWTKRLNLCKPLFDWRTNDIFKYLYDNDIKYCELYNHQMWAGDNLRVCSPLHATPAKELFKLREVDPTVYEQIMQIFPEMTVQERYWNEFSPDKVIDNYSQSWAGLKRFIIENLDADQMAWAMKELEGVFSRAQNSPQSYPIRYVFSCFVNGKYLYPIQPLGKKAQEKYV